MTCVFVTCCRLFTYKGLQREVVTGTLEHPPAMPLGSVLQLNLMQSPLLADAITFCLNVLTTTLHPSSFREPYHFCI